MDRARAEFRFAWVTGAYRYRASSDRRTDRSRRGMGEDHATRAHHARVGGSRRLRLRMTDGTATRLAFEAKRTATSSLARSGFILRSPRQAPENGSFHGFGWRLLGMFGSKSL